MSEPLHHELQRHAGGLRDLARDLLRDRHAAEDVTQAALQQALARPPREPGPIGGWLHRTVVNFARQWRRGERRRVARETTLPARDPEPAVAEQLARREMLQRVTAAVLALDEPYQTTVFLRYFEDLPPRAIARRTGANVVTVKSRLARGLAMLRTRLDQPTGERAADWRTALASTFGLPTIGMLWPLPTGTLLVSSTTKTLFVAGALCVGGVLAYQFGDDPAPLPTGTTKSGSASAVDAAATAAPTPEATTQRTAAEAIAGEVAWLEHPYEVGLDVLVVDSLGLPIEGHKLSLAPFGVARNEADVATGPDGRAALTWRSRQRALDVQVADPRGQLRRVSLQHGARAQLTLLGRRTERGGFRLSLGTSLRATSIDTSSLQEGTIKLDAGFLDSLSSKAPDLRMRTGLHPAAVFGDPLAVVREDAAPPGPDIKFSFDNGEIVLSQVLVNGRTVSQIGIPKSKKVSESTTAIEGVVFGVDGKPAAKIPVVLLGSSPQPLQRGETDDQGRFRFQNVLAGEFTVRAGGDHQGLATTTAVVAQGTTPCTLNLQRGIVVTGKATDAAGKPRGEHLVEWRALDGSWCDATRTEKDGTFLFANLPAGPGALFLFARDGNKSIPIATLPSVLPNTNDAVLSAAENKGSVLRLEPPAPRDGQGQSSVLAWHADTGLAFTLQPPEKGAQWSSPKLPAGFYDLELRVAGSGSKPLGRHWLDGEHDFDLGRVEAPRGGSIRITLPASSQPTAAEQRALEVCVLRSDLDVRVEPTALPLDRSIALPVGDYVLAFRHADGGVRFHRFSVTADHETVVAPAP